ncbi:MAG: hypothetical protein ABI065_06730 [Terrimesophilobacter sp.]
MHGIFKARGLAFVATLALLGGTVWIAAGTTGAYFSDTHDGTISGTVGSIQVHTTGIGGTGTDGMNLSFEKLLPGTPQTVSVDYSNTGNSPEDVWVVFPNSDALAALNDLGTFGEFGLSSSTGGHIFYSHNLRDDRNHSCGELKASGCWPLTKQYRVASAVQQSASGSVTFTFGIGADANDQKKFAAGAGLALPYQIVATQVGIKPSVME